MASTDEDISVNIEVLSNDYDLDNDELTVVSATKPANGGAVLNKDGTITYTPDANFTGTDSFNYTIEDEEGLTDTATVTINIGSVNDVPIAENDQTETDEDIAVIISVLANDSDPDGDELTVVSTTEPENGSLTINTDGTITYTPYENFNGTDSFDYTIEDEEGLQDTATVTVTVNPINDAPVAVDDMASTDEDISVNIEVLSNDYDIDNDELSVVSATKPANGGAVLNQDGTITYTPDANFTGIDSFNYTIEDEEGFTDTATVTINIGSVNDVPIAENDQTETDEDIAVIISVLANDSDPDGDELTVVSTTEPENGSLTINT